MQSWSLSIFGQVDPIIEFRPSPKDGETMTEWKREAEVDGMNIDMWGLRLFKFGEVTKPNSPFGFLPKFRFWMMDPNGMGLLGYSKPAADGSSREL